MTTALDVSGNGKNGTYNKTPAFTTGLVPGDTAWNVPDVINNYISVPDSTVNWLTAWSMDFWFQQSPTIDSVNLIKFLVAEAAAFPNTVIVNLDNSIEELEVSTDGTMTWAATIGPPNDHATHYIAITYNGSTAAPVVAMYVDGASVTTTVTGNWNPSFTPSAVPLTEHILGLNQFAGTLDEFAIYPTTLTSGQVAAHYAARTSFAAYTAAVLADSPAVYYHLDGGSSGWFLEQIGMSA